MEGDFRLGDALVHPGEERLIKLLLLLELQSVRVLRSDSFNVLRASSVGGPA